MVKKISNWIYKGIFIGLGIIIFTFNDTFGSKEPYTTIALVYFLSLIVFLGYWGYKKVKSIIVLKDERRKAELQHLKSQVNPHFFFNTLNNLYGLVDEDTTKTKALILKLSDMMSYSIYKGEQEFVTIQEEVDYLQDYIDLHQIRYYKKVDIKFEVNIEQADLKVMPLLFIILLENAFKHGVEKLRANAYIYAKLNVTSDRILFEIENNFDPEEAHEKVGIGLKNLKKRLELAYPKKHQLVVNQMNNIFKVGLSITYK